MESTIIPTTKRCPKCGRVLPISDFGKDSRASDKHLCYCKQCATEAQKQRRIERNKAVFNLLNEKFTLKDYIEAIELTDNSELSTTPEGAKRALSLYCHSGVVSRIDDTYYRKVSTSPLMPKSPVTISNISKMSQEKPVVTKTLSSYTPIELMAELYKRGYRWKDMTVTTFVPIQNVQDYVSAHA